MNEESSLPAETGDRVPAESSALEVEATDPPVVSETLRPGFVPVETEKSLADWFTEAAEVTEATVAVPSYVPEETVAETVAPVTVDVFQDG